MNSKAIVRGSLIILHDDLMIEILLRLLVKSLLRFKSVCHRWRTIISSPGFISNHYHHESNTTTGHLIYWEGSVTGPRLNGLGYKCCNTIYVFSRFSSDDNGTLIRHEDPDPRDLFGPIMGMHGPCNGVFLVKCRNQSLSLWNPATRMLRAVTGCPLGRFTYISGFGIDPLTNDLKIVSFNRGCRKSRFAVYSVTDSSWRLCRNDALIDDVHVVGSISGPTFSNGFCYWLKCESVDPEVYTVLAFDIRKESFHEIEMPEFISELRVDQKLLDLYIEQNGYIFTEEDLSVELPGILERSVLRKLDRYGDSLALFAYQCLLTCDGRFDMWLLNEPLGCWTKVSTVPLPFGTLSNIGVWKMNHIFAVTSDNKLMVFDMDSGSIRDIEFGRVENADCDYIPSPTPYKESLVSL